MTRKRITSVWDAIEDTPEKAENMRLRSSLMIALKAHLVGSGLTHRQIAKHFGVTQPRVSDLMHGKIDEFGLDALVNMAAARQTSKLIEEGPRVGNVAKNATFSLRSVH